MRVLVVGAGGIGCYYGARLQAIGDEVVFTARGEHLKALQKNGLVIKHREFNFHQPVKAMDENSLFEHYRSDEFDLILLCIKAFDTSAWLQRSEQWLNASSTPILSLQNGVDNEALIANLLGKERTIGGLAVRIGGHVIQPGVVMADGPAQVIMGAWPNANANNQVLINLVTLKQHFEKALIPTRVTDAIDEELWRKLLINNGVNPLSAITGLTTRELVESPQFEPCVRQLMQETAMIARTEGVNLTDDDVEAMINLLKSFDAIKTSMLVDYEKGKPIELDEICGAVLARARNIGVTLPTNQLVYALLSRS